MRLSLIFVAVLGTTLAIGQRFETVPSNPIDVVRFSHRFQLADDERLIRFAVADGRLLLIGTRSIRRYDLASGATLDSSPNAIKKIDSLVRFWSISPDGGKAVSLDPVDNRLSMIRKSLSKRQKLPAIVWDLPSSARLATLEGKRHSIRDAFWSLDGTALITSSFAIAPSGEDDDTEICFWDAVTLNARGCVEVAGKFAGGMLTPNGSLFVGRFYTSLAAWVEVFDALSTTSVKQIESRNGMGGFKLSRSGRYLAVNYVDRIEIVALADGFRSLATIRLAKKSSWISFGEFSSDERLFALKNGKNGIEIRETEGGRLLTNVATAGFVPSHWVADDSVVIGAECGRLIAVSVPKSTEIYRMKLVCKTSFDPVSTSIEDEDAISVHPSGKFLLTHSGTAVRIWNSLTGQLLQTIVRPDREKKKNANPKSDDRIKGRTALWSTDGRYLLIADADQRSVLKYDLVGN